MYVKRQTFVSFLVSFDIACILLGPNRPRPQGWKKCETSLEYDQNCKYCPPKAKFPGNKIPNSAFFPCMPTHHIKTDQLSPEVKIYFDFDIKELFVIVKIWHRMRILHSFDKSLKWWLKYLLLPNSNLFLLLPLFLHKYGLCQEMVYFNVLIMGHKCVIRAEPRPENYMIRCVT